VWRTGSPIQISSRANSRRTAFDACAVINPKRCHPTTSEATRMINFHDVCGMTVRAKRCAERWRHLTLQTEAGDHDERPGTRSPLSRHWLRDRLGCQNALDVFLRRLLSAVIFIDRLESADSKRHADRLARRVCRID
jgi:hypothetical protein